MMGMWLMLDKLAINYNNIAYIRLKGRVVYIVLLSGYIVAVTYSSEDRAKDDYETYLEDTKEASYSNYSFTDYKSWAILERGNSALEASILKEIAPLPDEGE